MMFMSIMDYQLQVQFPVLSVGTGKLLMIPTWGDNQDVSNYNRFQVSKKLGGVTLFVNIQSNMDLIMKKGPLLFSYFIDPEDPILYIT